MILAFTTFIAHQLFLAILDHMQSTTLVGFDDAAGGGDGGLVVEYAVSLSFEGEHAVAVLTQRINILTYQF